MKLIELKINSEFRNLNGICVKFQSDVDSYVLIGNNGSGKTSILEAISAIFDELYYGNSNEDFAYVLRYEIDEHHIVIIKKKGNNPICKVDGDAIDFSIFQANYLPSRLICNYSGEDFRIKELFYKKRYEEYIQELKKRNSNVVLKLLFVDKQMWRIIFLIMLICKDNVNEFRNFLENTIGFNRLDKIKLELDAKALSGWQDNATTYYLSLIDAKIHSGEVNLEDLNPLGDNAQSLFLKLLGGLPLVKSLKIFYNGGVSSEYLSEGEKKLMTILFIQEAIADERSLVLLDEPDSHIHVARKDELKKVLCNIDNRESILTSHSPTLTAKYPDEAIIMLDRSDTGIATVISKEKKDIIAKLTGGIWSLQEQNIFLASNKDVLLVEGKTDEVFLSKALSYLQTQGKFLNMDFSYLPCGGASNVNELLQRFNPKKNQMMICFFDSDKSGWIEINKIFSREGANAFSSINYGKARKLGKIWFAPYPKPKSKRGTIFNIEDYFSRSIFLRYIMRFRSLDEIITKDSVKRSMERDCNSGKINGKHFEKFEFVFMLIDNIRTADKNGEVIVF